MNFHEYQAKELFAAYGIPVPAGIVAATPLAAVEAARELGGNMWMVKAQVHAGGRGKAGGVKLARSLDEVRTESERMLNMKISTYQTGGLEMPVDNVLIAEAVDIVGAARDSGAMFPRVEEVGSDQIPDHCKYCAVAEVCRRDDSGFRRRLVAWMANSDSGQKSAEKAARDLWHLGAEEKDPK